MVQVARSPARARAPRPPMPGPTRPSPMAKPRAHAPLAVISLPAAVPAPRDYRREDLRRIAEIGFHYTLSGGLELGAALFEGLVAIAPDEPLFCIGLGLTYWKQGELERAQAAYARAASLDPAAPLPELSLAELSLERGRRAEARAHLASAVQKANRAKEAALLAKAKAMLSLVSEGSRS